MTPLLLRMIEDMKSAGLAAGTQAVHIDAVRRLAPPTISDAAMATTATTCSSRLQAPIPT
jgi:hypothetical protein